jgi:hypothetical protein
MLRLLFLSYICIILNLIVYPNLFSDDQIIPFEIAKIKWKDKTGAELIIDLQNNTLKRLAMEELISRNNKDNHKNKGFFLNEEVNLKVIKCPTEKGFIIVVLHDPSWSFNTDNGYENKYQINNPREIITLDDKDNSKLNLCNKQIIVAFDNFGNLITPFGGNNMIDKGIFLDLNKDGSIERASFTRYTPPQGVNNIMVLEIYVVSEKPKPLLYVLYNYGADNWDYQFVDRDKDGLFEIEFGPKHKDSIKPEVVYQWDNILKAYIGPKGKDGDHFRRIDDYAGLWATFEKFETEKTVFPIINSNSEKMNFIEITDEDSAESEQTRRIKANKRVLNSGEPYQYTSLIDLSDKDLIAFGRAGKGYNDTPEMKNLFSGIPKNIMALDPKKAALKIFNANRSKENRNSFKAEFDDRNEIPPNAMSLHYTYHSSRCYGAFDKNYSLFISPEKSYLAICVKSEAEFVFIDYREKPHRFNITNIQLSYEEALFVGQTIWWLNQIRTWQENSEDRSGLFSMSTADGTGAFLLKTQADSVAESINGTIWGFNNHVERFSAAYDKEVFLNYVDLIFDKLIDVVIQNRNVTENQIQPKISTKQYLEIEENAFHNNCYQILELFLTAPNHHISTPIALEAIIAAGSYQSKICLPLLKKIEEHLNNQKKFRSITDVKQDLSALKILKNQIENKNEDKKIELRKQERALSLELISLNNNFFGEAYVENLRKALKISLKKFNVADNITKTFEWACSHEEDYMWALNHLKALNQEKYLEALQWWLKDESSKNWRSQIYEEIKNINNSTTELIVQLEKIDQQIDESDELSKINQIPFENERVDSLKKLILDPTTAWELRGKAIDFLVPAEDPMKYNNIDSVLIEVLNRYQEQDMEYSIDNAMRGLSLRAYSGDIEPAFEILKNSDYYRKLNLLDHMIFLMIKTGGKHRQQLLDYIKPQLSKTNFDPNDFSTLIYGADLNELIFDLSKIATHSQTEYEGLRSIESGGNAVEIDKRYHGPRLMVALMREKDPFTKAKLLVIIAPQYFMESFQFRSQKEFKELYKSFNPIEKTALKQFVKDNTDQKACEYNSFTKFMYDFLFDFKVKK